MNNYTTQAAQLEESLQLSLPPVALAFADELPAGVQPLWGGGAGRLLLLAGGGPARLFDNRQGSRTVCHRRSHA